MPIVRYEDAEGTLHLVEVKGIDQISYILNPPIDKQFITVANVLGKSPRVFGYLNFIVGLFLVLPALAVFGLEMEKGLFAGQVLYILIFIGLLLGGWSLLKIIQRL